MNNKAKSIIDIQPDDKSESGFINNAKNAVSKALEQTPSIIFAGVVGLALLGVVAMYGLSVIKSSDCGGSLSFKSSQSSQEFEFKKEACNKTLDD
ncbi:hypothetical protein [Nostoc sp. ChiSLP03a]|uniref:hypothetical protein n=1 Tax=Nostoc sp. ChiSLP03a TaxID=3075380 RepID=UPI002AD34AC5|nr:hypothetical protein [Nostoc sp. ChiSLP03a]MDZ8213787.1 hypothetical protein [Nostoc sp. ChiSLP03a]